MARATSKRVRYKNKGNTVEKKQFYTPPTEGQAVGVVRKCEGGSRFKVDVWKWKNEVFVPYNCSIPGSMKGRNKKRHFITIGSIVLVNLDMRISMGEIILLYTRNNILELISDLFWIDESNQKYNDVEEENFGFDFETPAEKDEFVLDKI